MIMERPDKAKSNPLKDSARLARLLRSFAKKNPSVIYLHEKGKYPCIEAWQFLGSCLGLTAGTERTEETAHGYVAHAVLRNAQGVIVGSGHAECLRSEPDWADKPAFQLRSMSQTRACAKAHRNASAHIMVMAGFSATPAEEMGQNSFVRESHSPMRGKKCSECGNQLSDKRARDTTKKQGKPLCIECGPKFPSVVNDPGQVGKAVHNVQERKASQGQPVVEAMAHTDPDEKVIA